MEQTSNTICAVCLEQFRCPKFLSCCHSFCQRCVEKVAGGKPSFPCPTCSTVILLPPGGAKELQTNVDLEKNLARAMAEGGAECEVCTSGKPAVGKCVQCQQLYCQPCKQTHDSTSCSDHSVLQLGEGAAAAEKTCAKEIVYSKNQKVLMTDMILAAEEKMWVLFRFEDTDTRMALFDSRARRLEHHYESLSGKLACEGDTLVVIPDGKSASPGGKFGDLGKMEFDTRFGWLLSRPCPSYYILKRQTGTEYRDQQVFRHGKYIFENVPCDVAGAADIVRIASLTSSPPKLEVKALCSDIQKYTAVAEYSTKASTFAVSADERFLAFLHPDGVSIYLKDPKDSSKLKTVAHYKTESEIVDLVFSPVGGKELLIVACHDDNAVLVLDHEDGCCLVRALQSDKRPIPKPFRLAVNSKGRLWVGCHGGKILIFDL